jgi:hypothetical protein
MLAVGVLTAVTALVLGLRFSVVTLVLLTVAIVISFATSVLGGSGPLVVGLQMLATLASVQISYLIGCLLASHLPLRAEILSDRMQMRCVAFRQHISGKIESRTSGHCAIIFDPKDQGCQTLGPSMTPRSDGAMNPRRLAITAAALLGTVILVGGVIVAVAGFGMADVRNTGAARIEDGATTEMAEATVSNADSAATAVTAIAKAALPDASQRSAPETVPVQLAAVSASGQAHIDTQEVVSSAETLDESLPDSSETLGRETPPVQVATASTSDLVHSGAKEAASSTPTLDEPLPDSSQALAPPDGKEAVTSTEAPDDCLEREVCIDQYLWSVYQRAPKEDTIKVVERRKVIVKTDGKPQTVVKEFTRLVDNDFTWKDPKAAEKAGMSLMEYVIGGMDRDFKLKLYHALRAMDDAGLSPGITSAFRDDYRQSLASGLKAATNRSYHGGSLRGGYGHGLAADLVSVKGETRAERFTSSEHLWKWIDLHGKEFGIGRPYLDKDPAHVAPIDGKEYADHRRGANTQHARSETKTRNLLTVRDDHNIAKLAKTARSSNF